MSLIYNGTTISKLIYNGTEVQKMNYNEVEVFSKGPIILTKDVTITLGFEKTYKTSGDRYLYKHSGSSFTVIDDGEITSISPTYVQCIISESSYGTKSYENCYFTFTGKIIETSVCGSRTSYSVGARYDQVTISVTYKV